MKHGSAQNLLILSVLKRTRSGLRPPWSHRTEASKSAGSSLAKGSRRVKWNELPLPTSLSTQIVPPIISTSCLINSPSATSIMPRMALIGVRSSWLMWKEPALCFGGRFGGFLSLLQGQLHSFTLGDVVCDNHTLRPAVLVGQLDVESRPNLLPLLREYSASRRSPRFPRTVRLLEHAGRPSGRKHRIGPVTGNVGHGVPDVPCVMSESPRLRFWGIGVSFASAADVCPQRTQLRPSRWP